MRQDFGVVNRPASAGGGASWRGLVALHQLADRGQDLGPRAKPLFRPINFKTACAALVGSFQGRPDQSDALGVVLGAVGSRSSSATIARAAARTSGSGSESLRSTAVWIDGLLRPAGQPEEARELEACRRGSRAGRRSRAAEGRFERTQVRLIQEAELAVVAHVDHGLGLAS